MAKTRASAKTKKSKGNIFARASKKILGRPKTFLLIGVLIVVLLVGLIPKVQESFASGCSGRKIDVYSIRKPSTGQYAGYVELYWNGSKNCAIAYGGGITSGDKIWREICIKAGSQRADCDSGYFKSYAGPVWTGKSKGKCISLYASFDKKKYSPTHLGWVKKTDVHC